MANIIKKVKVEVDGKVNTFKGDDLTSPVQQAILYLKSLEKELFDE